MSAQRWSCPFLLSTTLLQLGLMAHWAGWTDYGTFCLWNKSKTTPPTKKKKRKENKPFLYKLASYHLSIAIHKHSPSVCLPWYCMYGSVPLIETQRNNWGKFQSMLLCFTSCATCASDQLKSMLSGTWTVLLLPNQSIGQDKSYHWLCRRRPPAASQAHLSTPWWAWDIQGPWFSFPHCSAST